MCYCKGIALIERLCTTSSIQPHYFKKDSTNQENWDSLDDRTIARFALIEVALIEVPLYSYTAEVQPILI